jgi:hypothetical protein
MRFETRNGTVRGLIVDGFEYDTFVRLPSG